jgi:hypothetical protein
LLNLRHFNVLTQHPDPTLQRLWVLVQLSWLLVPVHGVAFGAIAIFAMILGTHHHGRQLNRRWLNRAFCLLACWIAGISFVAHDFYAALLGMANVLPFFLLFITYSFVIQTIEQLWHLARLSIITAGLITFLGIGQYFLQWQGPPQPWEGILGWALALGGDPPGRMASVFMYANSMAAYLVMVLPLAIVYWLQHLPPTPHASPTHRHFPSSILHFLPVLAIFICIVCTHSRNAWGIAALTCLAIALYRGWYWILAVLAAGISMVWSAAFAPAPASGLLRQVVPRFIWARLTDELYPNRPIAELRSTQWEFAWWMTTQRPFTGWGLRSFTPIYLENMQFYLGHPHNIFLMFSAELGIPATLVLCGLVGWVLFQAVTLLWCWRKDLPGACADDRLLLFGYVLAFSSCILFNCLDVTALDVRVNAVGWLILSAIAGIVQAHPTHTNPAIADLSSADATSP